MRKIRHLQGLVRNLRECNGELRRQIELSEHRTRNITAVTGERFLRRVLGGNLTLHNEGHDLLVGRRTFEVKAARSARIYPECSTCRWSWHKMFGVNGRKKYHRLLLLGKADPNHRRKYKDPESAYVMFDLSPADVRRIWNKRAPRLIQLTTNPEATRSKTGKQLWRHQVSSKELRQRYR